MPVINPKDPTTIIQCHSCHKNICVGINSVFTVNSPNNTTCSYFCSHCKNWNVLLKNNLPEEFVTAMNEAATQHH